MFTVICNISIGHLTMDKCPICLKGIQQHARKITCCICHSTHHMKCLSIGPNELNSLEYNRPEWFCAICLSQLLPLNHIGENNDFYAVAHEVFQPFEYDYNDYEELNDNDPDFNFYIEMNQNRSCNYCLESTFHDKIKNEKREVQFLFVILISGEWKIILIVLNHFWISFMTSQ